jgi:hypothetical protein
LDFRKNPVTFRNYRFGYSTYRGGLFVGFADDPSRIARIYLKFPFPSPPFEPDDQIWDASLLMFYTEPHESSVDIPSDPTQPHPINLKVYLASSNDWGQRSIHWSNKPSISDPAFLLFEGFAYPGSWVEIHDGKNPENYSETRRFKDIVANNVTFTYVLTMPDDNPNYCLLPDPTEKITMQKRWKYFAKREFKERWAPYVLRSYRENKFPQNKSALNINWKVSEWLGWRGRRGKGKGLRGLLCLPLSVAFACSLSFFLSVSLFRFHRLTAYAYDLGIFMQGVWLMSQGETPFVTLRGLHLFADHFSPILLLFVPLYRLYPHPFWFFLFQSFSFGLCALPSLSPLSSLAPFPFLCPFLLPRFTPSPCFLLHALF